MEVSLFALAMGAIQRSAIFFSRKENTSNLLVNHSSSPTLSTVPATALTNTSFHFYIAGLRKSHLKQGNQVLRQIVLTMATASATLSPAVFAAAAATVASPRRKNVNARYIAGLNSFGGLKAQNKVTALGLPVCTEQSFAKMVSSLRAPSKRKGRGGGALSSTCNAAGEIFRIAAIMNGLVLVGVAVGFVLLRIEASVEEAE